jgi:L-threonylcarbamoyladenylate synthase
VIEEAVAALQAGKLAILPTDTVYGLAARAGDEAAVRRLYAAKGRGGEQPTALVAASIEVLLAAVPELRGRAEAILRALLPGPYTLVLPNPAQRFPGLNGSSPHTIGVRIPQLAGPGGEVLERVEVLAATSANVPGGPDPRSLADVPGELLAGAAAVVDGGDLPGAPSTVLDFSGPQPSVLRQGAAPAGEALAHVAAVLSFPLAIRPDE